MTTCIEWVLNRRVRGAQRVGERFKQFAHFLQVTAQALRSPAMDLLPNLLHFSDAEVRAAAVFALGAMIQAHSPAFPGPGLGGGAGAQRMGTAERVQAERQIAEHLIATVDDASPLVRSEVAVAFGRVACGHADMFQVQSSAFVTPADTCQAARMHAPALVEPLAACV